MTKTEFKKLIAESTNPEWFKTKKITLNCSKTNFNKVFNNILLLYDYLFSEQKKWENCTKAIPKELNESKNYFKNLKDNLENFVERYSDKDENQFNYNWSNHDINNYLNNSNFIFEFNQPETTFLIEIFNNEERFFLGAFYFFTNQMNGIFIQKENFIGASLANDFIRKETSLKYSRKDFEQKSFESLKKEFKDTIIDASSTVIDHLKDTNDKYEECVNSIEKQKEEKDLLFQEWFNASKKAFDNFNNASTKKIEELKKLYEEELALKAPAQYWEERAKEMRIQGQWWLGGLCISTIVGVFFLYNLLGSIGTGEFETMFKDTGTAIKWSIVFITFVTFLAFLIRTFTKLTFSSFHLARDAQERKQLTYVYLALKENKAVSDIDRNIVLQSIFSRADTGLLKEDSSPTMPSTIIEKVVKP